jgi:hypothetical protein
MNTVSFPVYACMYPGSSYKLYSYIDVGARKDDWLVIGISFMDARPNAMENEPGMLRLMDTAEHASCSLERHIHGSEVLPYVMNTRRYVMSYPSPKAGIFYKALEVINDCVIPLLADSMIRDRAARKIQHRWRHVIANPQYVVCKKRLMREFLEI